MRKLTATALATTTFFLGIAATRLLPEALAAETGAGQPTIIHLGQLKDEEIGAPMARTTLRSRTLYTAPGAAIGIQTGDAPKHLHRDSDEVQYIIEGTGTFWLGDTRREVGPGDLIIIPKGTAHAGTVATSGRFKALSIKTPPQGQHDIEFLK